MSKARALLADSRLVVAREGLALQAAFWAQYPGNFKLRVRPPAPEDAADAMQLMLRELHTPIGAANVDRTAQAFAADWGAPLSWDGPRRVGLDLG